MLAIKGTQGMWNIPPNPEFPFQFFPLIWSSRTFEVISGELILDGPADLQKLGNGGSSNPIQDNDVYDSPVARYLMVRANFSPTLIGAL